MAYGMGSGLAGSGTVGQLAGQNLTAARFVSTPDGAAGTPQFELGGHSGNGLFWETGSSLATFAVGGVSKWQYGAGAIIPFSSGGMSLGLTGSRFASVFSNATFDSSVASGSNAFQVSNNGARVAFGAGASDYASSDGTTVTFAGPIANSSASNAIGSAASGTGITVGYNGAIRRGAFKITTTFAAWSAAALFLDITFGVLPAKARLVSVIADTTAAYVLGGGTIVLTVGKTAGGAEYIASHDIKTAAVTKGLADADMGTLLTRAAAIQGGDMAAAMWTGTTNLQGRITSSAGNLSTMSAGSTTFYFIIEYF